MDRPGSKVIRSEGAPGPNATHGESPNSASCASSCRMNEEVNGSFQKYTLLIIKKLAIDLLFLLEVNTIIEIYNWSVGVTPFKAARNSDQGPLSSPDPSPIGASRHGPLPHWPPEEKGAHQLTPATSLPV